MQAYRINRPAVIDEILDGELVIINLKSGVYFSLDSIGAVVWQRIDAGVARDDIGTDLYHLYDAADGSIEPALDALLATLLSEQLIVPSDATVQPGHGAPPPPARRASFAAPVLQKYTDMQDLLLLDPIHEVDESGWPTTKS